MTPPIVFRPEAQADLLAARNWYDEQRWGLGDELADAVREAVARIAKTPDLHEAVFANARRTKVRRFPYVVYYRVFADRIEILAVLHGRRDPRLWEDRL